MEDFNEIPVKPLQAQDIDVALDGAASQVVGELRAYVPLENYSAPWLSDPTAAATVAMWALRVR